MKDNQNIAVYPGSFDPITLGHLDIIERASKIFDKLYVAVLCNKSKKTLFFEDERVSMIVDVVKHIPNVEVCSFDGLSIDFLHSVGAHTIVRGLRAVTDFEYELQLSQTNRIMSPDIDTVFLTTDLKYAYLSSSIVKEVASYGGNIDAFVPPEIIKKLQEKFMNKEDQNE